MAIGSLKSALSPNARKKRKRPKTEVWRTPEPHKGGDLSKEFVPGLKAKRQPHNGGKEGDYASKTKTGHGMLG